LKKNAHIEKNFIKFLGTAGARIVVAKQLRASGGIWLSLSGTNLLIDPGPGCLVHCSYSRPKLDPTILDGIILTHRHLDHSADINVMMEAMSLGGHNKKGVVFAPKDALDDKGDHIIYKYVRAYVNKLEILKEKKEHQIGNVRFKTPIKHQHGNSETYGLMIWKKGNKKKRANIAYISDTKYFNQLPKYYNADIVIMNILRPERSALLHLSVEDAKEIIKQVKPKLAIMTHFGMCMVKGQPWKIAEDMTQELGVKVVAAKDGMSVEIRGKYE